MSVDVYIAKRGEFENVKNRVKGVADTIAMVASSLQSNPAKFIFSNQPIGLPMEATMSRDGRSVPAGDWPSVEQIMRLLEEYHRLKSEMQQAWGALGPNEQSSMKSPNDLLSRY
jgi:hypothetical protein